MARYIHLDPFAVSLSSAEDRPVYVRQSNGATAYDGASETTLASLLDCAEGISANTMPPGQATMAFSSPVVLASDHTAIKVSDGGGSLTVDGTIAATQSGTWNVTNISGTVSLPTGAATLSAQQSQTGYLTTIDAQTLAIQTATESIRDILPATRGQALMDNSLPVVIASNQSALTVTVSGPVNSNNFPTTVATDSGVSNASTLRTVLATRHESSSTPISVRISNGTNFATPSPAGRAYADSVRKDYSGGSVTTGAWTQLIASTAAEINALMIFDSSGQTLELGTGAAAAETRRLLIPPGGFAGPVPLQIAAGTRLSVRAVSGNASSGELSITGLS